MPILETQRLRLRPFTLGDINRIHEQFDGHPDVWRYDPGYPPTRTQRQSWLIYRIQELRMQGVGCLGLELKESSELIGCCGLEFVLHKGATYNTPEIEIYYRLGRDYWGCGYATEASLETLRHAFEDLRLPRVLAHASSENKASHSVMRRLGMTIEPHPLNAEEVIGVVLNYQSAAS
ncbi:GNAT family N-acetyltransferase [soil metagenome]